VPHPVPVTRTRALVPAAVTVAVLTGGLLAGCGGGTDTTSAGATSSPTPAADSAAAATGSTAEQAATAASTSSAAPSSSFVADTRPDTQDASADARVTVREVRVARQDGFDRVVLEMGGTGIPGWDVQYVDAATDQGRGEPVGVAGDAVLQVLVTGAGYPYDTGVDEVPARQAVRGAYTQVVTEVVPTGTFEGTTQVFVGTAARAAFRVYALTGPTRIVIEVADPT
jgi:hypothetical protein